MQKEELDKYVAQQLTKARKKAKFTQSEIANKLGVSNSSIIGRYENTDRQPNLYNLYMMSKLYDTDVNFYFPEDKKNSNNDIPIYVVIQDITDLDKIKKATSMLTVSNDFENCLNCFAYVPNYSNSNLDIKKDDIIIFERVTAINEEGIYILKLKGQEQKQETIISDITIQDNNYILHINNKPIIIKKDEIIPLGKARELRRKF